MSKCKKLEPLITPYVDGELDTTRRAEVDAHLGVCPPCHEHVDAERSVRALLQARKAALQKVCAPRALRDRCAAARIAREAGRTANVPVAATRWRAPVGSLALAATLVLIVGGAFLYEVTDRSARVMAAELVADHVKCFSVINPLLGANSQPAAVEASIALSLGWHLRLPERPEQAGLELVGARPCLYGEGRVAHLMYRYNGHPLSVFMLPKTVRSEEVIDVLGHQAVIWSVGDRSFVLVAREPRVEVERLASFVHAALR